MRGQRKSGTLTGTGAAMNVELGFTPVEVHVFNRNTAGSLDWYDSMPDAAAVKRVTAGTQTYITSNGISKYAGAAGSASKGFTLGTDATNGSGNTLDYVAIGPDE